MSTKTKLWIIFGLLAGGFGLGLVFARWSDNRQIVQLQATSDSINTAAAHRDTAATHYADSLKHQVDSLQKSKAPRIVELSTDSEAEARADSALAAAHSASDSLLAVLRENTLLKRDKILLIANARTDSISLWAAMARGDSLQQVVHDQTAAIAKLNEQVQALNAHTLPKWARLGFEAVRWGLAVKGGADLLAHK